MKTTGLPPVIQTELQRVLYNHPEGNVTWLAKKLGVQRQTCGDWVRGKEKIPVRRQTQMLVHLECYDRTALFDDRGVARRLDGQTLPVANEGGPGRGRRGSTYVSPLERARSL
jgi:hypothetical protein